MIGTWTTKIPNVLNVERCERRCGTLDSLLSFGPTRTLLALMCSRYVSSCVLLFCISCRKSRESEWRVCPLARSTLRSSSTPLRYNVVSRARGQPPQTVASAGRDFLHPSRMAPSTARGAPAIQEAVTPDTVPSWDTQNKATDLHARKRAQKGRLQPHKC